MNISNQQWMRDAALAEIESLLAWQRIISKHGLRIATQFALAELLVVARADTIPADAWHAAMQNAWQVGEDIQDALEHTDLERALIALKQIHGDNFEAAWQHLIGSEV